MDSSPPESVSYIADDAFEGCEGVVADVTADSVALSWCIEHQMEYTIDGEKPQESDEQLLQYLSYEIIEGWDGPAISITGYVENDVYSEVVLPATILNYPVERISSKAFQKVNTLKKITIPQNVNYIGERAFSDCVNLQEVILLDGIVYISRYAFANCSNLSEIQLPSELQSIEIGVFQGCTSLEKVIIPEQCSSMFGIRSNAFDGCSKLAFISLPDSMTYIGSYAFRNCISLNCISFPDGIAEIGDSAFYGCEGLQKIAFSKNIAKIGISAFRNCKQLESINLPKIMSSIGSYAFSGCSALEWVSFPNVINTIGSNAFGECVSLKNAFLPNNLSVISSNLFSGSISLEKVLIPEGAVTIENAAFSGCSALKDISIPDSVTVIGESAFKECKSITCVKLSKALSAIETETFAYCTSLSSIIIPEGVTTIGRKAFYCCSQLTGIYLPTTLVTLEAEIFEACSQLKSIILPSNLKSIPYRVFRSCHTLKTIVIPDGVEKIESYAFAYCDNLQSIYIPSTVSSIEEQAFLGYNENDDYWEVDFPNYLHFYGIVDSYAARFAQENSISFSSDSFPETLVTLSGRILDREGGGISGVTVRLYLDRNDQQEPVTVVTDEDGVWRYTAAKAWHDYLITLSKGRYRFGVSQLVCNVKDTDTAVQTLYGSLLETPYVTVGGSVTTKNGVGVSGVTVRIVDPETLETLAWASTADNGEWRIQLTAVNKIRWAVYQAADYQLSAAQVSFSADQDSTLPTVTAALMSSGSGEISFTVENDRLYTGEPVLFTVVSPKATRARLIVDGVAYNEFPLDDGKAEITRIFTQGGNREIAFQAYLDGSWGVISAAQTLSIETEGTLEAPQFQIPAKVVCGTTVALSWDAVAHADQYVIYLYRGGVILSREETTECSFEISGSSLLTEGQYSVEVIATGKRYGQKSYAQLFDVYRPESSLSIETPAASDSFVAGDTFYIKISNPDQLYLGVCVTAPDGSSVFYPQTGISNAAEQLFTYICEFSGKYQIEAFGFATAVNLDWGHPLAAAEPVEITVHASEIASVSVGNGKENQIISETALEVKAVVNNAVQEVKVYENEVLLATITDFTEADFVRTFTGSIPMLEEGVHTIRFEAADGENHIAKRLFTFYGVTSVSNLPDQYAVQDGVELYRYPDGKTVQGTLSTSDKLKIMGSFGDYYYAAVEGVEGYVLKQKVFEYSDETRNKIQLTLINRVPGEGLEAYIADEHWIDLLWQVENIPENCHMALELLTQQGNSALWSDSLYKLETLADNQFRYSVLSTALQGGEHYYAACSILTEDGVLVKRSLEDVFIFASWNDWLVSKQQEKLDLQFRNSGTVFSNVLVNRSADLMVAAYDKAQCLALMENGYGFKDLKDYNYTSGEHTVAFVIGHKVVLDADGKSTILYGIALRGTQGIREWISNFTLGTGKNHSGFMFAAEDAWTHIKNYMATFPDSQTRQACQENYKVWLTGHSRAAAVGNYLSATYFSNQVRRGDLYGYFFAVPKWRLELKAPIPPPAFAISTSAAI